MNELRETLLALDSEVREMLSEDLPAQLADVRAALDRQDRATAAEIAHAVRGSAAFCKLEALRAAAEQLEEVLVAGRAHSAAFESLQGEIARVLALINQEK